MPSLTSSALPTALSCKSATYLLKAQVAVCLSTRGN